MDSNTPQDPNQGANSVPNQVSQNAGQPVQLNTQSVQAPAANNQPVDIKDVKPEPKKPVLTPEEKKAARKASMKKLAITGVVLYVLFILFMAIWGFSIGSAPLSLFNALPVSQLAFNKFLMLVFNVIEGIVILGALVLTLMNLLKSAKAPKTDLTTKKKYSKMGLLSGGGFLLLAVVWLTLLALLTPRLVPEQFYESPIITSPENVIGLDAPVDITFDAGQIPISKSAYEILSYTWNFGDGKTANGQVVTHRYTQKGTDDGRYTVVLDVDYQDRKNGEQFDAQFTKEVSIANETVSAEFSALPDSGATPLEVEFDASASFDPDGDIVSYEWEFTGDDRFDDDEGVIVSYTFTQDGTYEVKLRVTDNNGQFNIATGTIEAGTVNGLRAQITSEDVASEGYYLVGEEYNFTAENSQIREGNITKYTWNFGDGSSRVESRRTQHTFTKAGIYEIELTVQDPQGNYDLDFLEVTVIAPGEQPTAVIETVPAAINNTVSGPFPLKVEFDASSSRDPDDDIIEYQWDFTNDGEIDEVGDTADFTYNEQGSYEARLVTIDASGLQSEAIMDIEVLSQGLVAVLNIDKTNGEVPLTVKFDASQSSYKEGNIVSYEYDWGLGGDPFIGGAEATFRYFEVGNFTASVTVVADDGERATDEVIIVVRPVAISACFTVGSDRGSAPFFLTVSASCSQGTITEYNWNFGDGEVSFDRQPDVHIYEEPGIYTVKLEVTSDQGVVSEFEKTVTVQ